jgi:hypothetical protein
MKRLAALLVSLALTASLAFSQSLPFPGPGGVSSSCSTADVYLTTGTTTWTVPSCWNVVNVECIGAGGSGTASEALTVNASGGAGGTWAKATNVAVTPAANLTVQVGAGGAAITATSSGFTTGNTGTDTWFNGANFAASVCGAKGGAGGTESSSGTALVGAVSPDGTANVGGGRRQYNQSGCYVL